MANKTGGLNKAKGLDALISKNRGSSSVKADNSPFLKSGLEAAASGTDIKTVKISSVVPNKEQPRKAFNEESLNELAESVRLHGVIVPLLVQKKDKYFEIIAGERRWRAAKLAGLKEIPVIIKDYTDAEAAEISLIENIQREDLNPIEEADAYKRLIDDYGLTQEEVAKKVSKSRSAVTNSMRLLKLDERVQRLLVDDIISMGHARALLAIENGDLQFNTANTVIARKMSVRETESYVKKLMKPKPEKPVEDTLQLDTIYAELEEKLKVALGTKVSIHRKRAGKGSIEIEYYSQDELERLLAMIDTIKTKG